jgi:hypothetical protein
VRPVLGVAARAAEREAVEVRLVVVAEAGEDREVVAALEDVDRVELQQAVPTTAAVDGRPNPCAASAMRRAWPAEREVTTARA